MYVMRNSPRPTPTGARGEFCTLLTHSLADRRSSSACRERRPHRGARIVRAMAATPQVTINGIDELKSKIGEEIGVSEWKLVTQEDINTFAEVTGDDQFIHIDEERAKETPFGGTIAHGFYTLSLAPRFSYDLFHLDGVAFGLNYGLNKVRFPAPLPVGSKVRMRMGIQS